MRAKGKKPSATPPSKRAPGHNDIVERVDALAEVLRRHELNEIEVEDNGVRLYLRRGAASDALERQAYRVPQGVTHAGEAVHHAAPTAGPPAESHTDTSDGNVSYITSPFVGTFYRSPGPDSAPFVDVGTHVKKAQVLCIVEAMKLMNEIESEIEGVVVQILVENGQAVEYGEPLFKIKQG
jgi:acetyl-CoA carboxylase biotin carboxyl carrier protein